MNCMKCGAEIREPEVFCEKCRADMERYPVKPNISIQLPHRTDAAPTKKRVKRQKYTKPEDQIRHLKSKIRWITLALVAALLAFALSTLLLLHLLEEQESDFGIGQNYGTMSTDAST